MSEQDPPNVPPKPPLADALLLPLGAPPALAKIPSPLPNYTILVHGVNDVGEAYPIQEEGICKGLNKRLHRSDLKAGTYKIPPDRNQLAGAMELLTPSDDPDAIYFQRNAQNDTYSPIIPFYWGFREEKGKLKEKEPHGQMLDRHGNRLSKKGWKNGGPFANATTCLPDMWADGFKNKILGFINLNWFSDPTHPLLPAQDRRYMVLAAQRLAALIRIIRKRQKYAAINIVAHSQGCMVSLLAQAMLAESAQCDGVVSDQQQAPVDCLIMNNPPYSLEEFMGMFDRAGLRGLQVQTTHARFETLKNIIHFITANRNTVPSLADLKDKWDMAGPAWQPDPDKEERRGKVFLYFTPEDRTVGMLSPQGIGWKGIPDKKQYHIGTEAAERPLLSTLNHFYQRIFVTKPRDGKKIEVGKNAYCVLRESGKPTWEKSFILLKELKEGEGRSITGPPLPEPFIPHLGEAKLAVTPMDAATAITNKGEQKDGDNQPHVRKKIIADPREAHEKRHDDDYGKVDPGVVENYLNQDKSDRQKIKVTNAIALYNGYMEISYHESFEEAQVRWQTKEMMDNSYHSGIVSDIQSSEKCAAYDMAVGITNIEKDRDIGKRMEENRRFIKYLTLVADWRMKDDKLLKSYTPWLEDDLRDPLIGPILKDNIDYFNTGKLPASLQKASLPPLVVSETFTYTTDHQFLNSPGSIRIVIPNPHIR